MSLETSADYVEHQIINQAKKDQRRYTHQGQKKMETLVLVDQSGRNWPAN